MRSEYLPHVQKNRGAQAWDMGKTLITTDVGLYTGHMPSTLGGSQCLLCFIFSLEL